VEEGTGIFSNVNCALVHTQKLDFSLTEWYVADGLSIMGRMIASQAKQSFIQRKNLLIQLPSDKGVYL
jgi:hypothetical protein